MTRKAVTSNIANHLNAMWDGRCYYCRRRVHHGVEIDHIIPFAAETLGETTTDLNDVSNLCFACYVCNRGKASEDAAWWLRQLAHPSFKLIARFLGEYGFAWFIQPIENDPVDLTPYKDDSGRLDVSVLLAIFSWYRKVPTFLDEAVWDCYQCYVEELGTSEMLRVYV